MKSRTTYIEQLQTLLNEWYREIEMLKQRAAGATPEKREDYATRLANLCLQCEAAKKKITALEGAEDSGWEELREGADRMWDGLKQLFTETKDAFQEGQEEAERKA